MGWLSDIVGDHTANFLETGDTQKGGEELLGGAGGEEAAMLLGLGLAPFTGGASLGAASAYLAYLGQKQTNKANAEQALAQMNFQERMSSTAHQREVQDLRLAGLNPILSVNAGASSPSGAMAVMQNPTKDLPSSIGQVYSNAKAMADTRLTTESINTQKTMQLANKAMAAQAAANTARAQAETASTLQEVNQNAWRGSKFGKWFGAVTGTIGDITGAVGNMFSGIKSNKRITGFGN